MSGQKAERDWADKVLNLFVALSSLTSMAQHNPFGSIEQQWLVYPLMCDDAHASTSTDCITPTQFNSQALGQAHCGAQPWFNLQALGSIYKPLVQFTNPWFDLQALGSIYKPLIQFTSPWTTTLWCTALLQFTSPWSNSQARGQAHFGACSLVNINGLCPAFVCAGKRLCRLCSHR